MKFQELRLLPLLTIFVLLFALSLVFPTLSFARSGCCSHHGGVCGCGCCDGTPLSSTCAPYYPECSQPVYTAPIATAAPVVYTPKPTIKAVTTLKPSVIPTPTTTRLPTEVPTPTSSPEVKGASVFISPSPTSAPATTGGVIGALAFLAVIIGLPILVIVKIVKKFRQPKPQI